VGAKEPDMVKRTVLAEISSSAALILLISNSIIVRVVSICSRALYVVS